jgi:hypothetical protein
MNIHKLRTYKGLLQRVLATDLFASIRLGWKGLPGTNTLAYLPESSRTKKKFL